MSTTVMQTEADVCNFLEALHFLTENRENCGKRHT
jgi:hypothetical protein